MYRKFHLNLEENKPLETGCLVRLCNLHLPNVARQNPEQTAPADPVWRKRVGGWVRDVQRCLPIPIITQF